MAKGKSRVENLHSFERTYSSGEISATLLNISLLNLGSDEEPLRNTAYDLATAVAASLNFDDSATLPFNGTLYSYDRMLLVTFIQGHSFLRTRCRLPGTLARNSQFILPT